MFKRSRSRLFLLSILWIPLLAISGCDTQSSTSSNDSVDNSADSNSIEEVKTIDVDSRISNSKSAPIDWQSCTVFDYYDWFDLETWSMLNTSHSDMQCGILNIPITLNAETTANLAQAKLPRNIAVYPDAKTIKLAISRLPATGTAKQKLGSLILIAGGPGQLSLNISLPETEAVKRLNTHFDLIGYAPRGVYPTTPKLNCHLMDDGKDFADNCWDYNPHDFLATLGTEYASTDIEAIRQALNEPKISLIGYSYGTKIAALYAEKYPENLRAAVLDGVMNLNETYFEADFNSNQGFQHSFERFVIDCQKQPNCYFSDTSTIKDAEAKLATLFKKIDEDPLYDAVTSQEVVAGISFALYGKMYWSPLNDLLSALEKGNPAPLKAFNAAITENMDWKAFNAIRCADMAIIEDKAEHLRKMRAIEATSTWDNYRGIEDNELISPCHYWPLDGSDVAHIPKLPATAPTLLLVAQTHDPATPYDGAIAMQQYLDAILLTRDADGHTLVLSGDSTDMDNKVVDYLLDPSSYKDASNKNWTSKN